MKFVIMLYYKNLSIVCILKIMYLHYEIFIFS